MFKRLLLLALLLLSPVLTYGQVQSGLARRVPKFATPPTCAATLKGFLYFDTDDNKTYFCNGTSWTSIAATDFDTLDELTDVTITSVATDQVLSYNGTVWVNSTVGLATNAQTGTSYTALTGDRGKIVTHSNGSAIAVALPQSGSAGFAAGWYYYTCSIGAGTTTITPTTSTINGAATYVLSRVDANNYECALIVGDGTNYTAMEFKQGGAGGGDSITVNTVAVTNADLDDTTPAAILLDYPRAVNSKWQQDGGSPANVSSYIGGFMPSLGRGHVQLWQAHGGAQYSNFGVTGSVSTSGTLAASAPTSAQGVGVTHTTAATTGSQGSVHLDATHTYHTAGMNIRFEAVMSIDSTTAIRFFAGYSTSGNLTGNTLNTDAPTVSLAAFRFATGVPDTNFQACTADGTTFSCTDTGVAADTANHLFTITQNSTTNIKFCVDTTCVTKSTNLPASATCQAFAGIETRADAAKVLRVQRIYMESDR